MVRHTCCALAFCRLTTCSALLRYRRGVHWGAETVHPVRTATAPTAATTPATQRRDPDSVVLPIVIWSVMTLRIGLAIAEGVSTNRAIVAVRHREHADGASRCSSDPRAAPTQH